MFSFALLLSHVLLTDLPKLDAVPFTAVKISDKFWSPRIETNRKVSLTHSLDMLEKAGNIEDFELAARGARTGYKGPVFMDSDLYKTLEAVSYSLASYPDATLEARIDGIIAKIGKAQMADGYLNTYYQVNEPQNRLTNLAWNHELYCAGHLFEAAVAHYQATKKTTLLSIAQKFADFLARTFGDKPGQRAGYCGHPEIELALVKLWKATGKREYFELAEFFINHRGEHFFARESNTPDDKYEGEYYQDQVPIRELNSIVGHAVRAGYLMSGVIDVARENGDKKLLQMVNRVWQNTTTKKMYLTGGIGPSASNEGFTVDYDLPNLSAYQETCASVAMVMWNHRLALLTGESKYIDTLETSLYNGVLAGYSLDGKRYFYVNPLASTGSHHRSEWFGCACCPPNVARTLSQLGGYAFATGEQSIYSNLFIQGTADVNFAGKQVRIGVETNYPWDGTVKYKLEPKSAQKFSFHLRKPHWTDSIALKINGREVANNPTVNGYVVIERTWAPGDTIEYKMALDVRKISANPQVKDNVGKFAVARGPLVYCLEQVDHTEELSSISVLPSSPWKLKQSSDLGGIVSLESTGFVGGTERWPGGLYVAMPEMKTTKLRAIPYYAWDNRKAGPMEVWLSMVPPQPLISGLESTAKVTMSFVNSNCQPDAVKGGAEPKSSNEQPPRLAHWWNHQGGTEWIQYEWPKTTEIAKVQVYWFDDTGRGACRLPVKWHLESQVDGAWQPIDATYPIKLDGWCEVTFEPRNVTRLRLVVEMQKEWAAGIHKWRVWSAGD